MKDKIQLKKLVRDRIPEIIIEGGGSPRSYVADIDEYGALLKEKLLEEVMEFLESETIEEVVDILEVLDALCVVKQFHKDEIHNIRAKKVLERGAFNARIVLEN